MHLRIKPHKLKLIVIRIGADGNLCLSKPCLSCLEKIRKYGIKKIYYSDANGDIVNEKIDDIKTSISSGHIAGLDILQGKRTSRRTKQK